jgi:hypothetical protein
MKALLNVVSAALLLAPALAWSQAAVVEGVQMPAWVERGGARTPLSPGMQLRQGDQLRTGGGSRLLLRLSEGSMVKLGENASLRVTELSPTKELFKGALAVLEGAFRFTTTALGANKRRDININVATVTAGVRGTDLWGKSVPTRQVVCLIEGKIEVGAPGETPVALDQSRQFYQRVNDQTQPVGFVDPAQLGEWAKETEIEAGKGAARSGGRYRVELAAADNQNDALAVYDQFRAAGYAAEIRPLKVEDKLVYRVQIRNLPSRAEAQALANQLKGRFGAVEPKAAG